jgi:predicted branched-subunit amino acid permease
MTLSPETSRLRAALAGCRDALALPAWVVGFGLFGVGSLARDVGYPADIAVLSTVLVWAGPSQVIFFASIAAGAAWSAIAIAIAFASLRFLPMTVSILPLLRRPGQGYLTQLLMAHCVAVTTWTEGLRRLPAVPDELRASYFLGFSAGCIGVSAGTTYAGFHLAGTLPLPLAAGLLCLTPIFFLASLTAGIRHRADVAALTLGLVLAPISAHYVGGGFDLVVSGTAAGTIAYLAQRRMRR